MSSILLVGPPNCGKTLLFNRLTGLQQKVANFPGVTVEIKRGHWQGHDLVDHPGTYSLIPWTPEEKVTVGNLFESLAKPEVKVVACVIDATQFERSYPLAAQLLKQARLFKKNAVLILNMADQLRRHRVKMDTQGLADLLKTSVIAVSAKTGEGFEELHQAFDRSLDTIWQAESEPNVEDAEVIQRFGPHTDVFVKETGRLDSFFLSTRFGGLIFLAIIFFIFQALFTWSVPLMDAVEALVVGLGEQVSPLFPEGTVRDFIADAIFGGVGTFIVFVPQIFVLTVILGLLEDSGYLARVAVLCHRPMKFFGLSGKSFIPYLSGHACAIPAIYATRMIDSPKKRLITLLTIPLISCSARLPIYSLFIVAVIPDVAYLSGLIHLRGLVFFALFFLGYIVALGVSAILSATIDRGHKDVPFVLELPSYRWPSFKPVVLKGLRSAWSFLSQAGPVIFVAVIIIWALGYFPHGAGHLDTSFLSYLGHWLEPIFRPIGLDWKYGVAVLTSFIAREVFVGTLGTFYGIEGAEDDVGGLATQLQTSGLSVPSGIALLIFYVIALQCVSTLAVIKKETNTNWIPATLFAAYTLLAYILALAFYQLAFI